MAKDLNDMTQLPSHIQKEADEADRMLAAATVAPPAPPVEGEPLPGDGPGVTPPPQEAAQQPAAQQQAVTVAQQAAVEPQPVVDAAPPVTASDPPQKVEPLTQDESLSPEKVLHSLRVLQGKYNAETSRLMSEKAVLQRQVAQLEREPQYPRQAPNNSVPDATLDFSRRSVNDQNLSVPNTPVPEVDLSGLSPEEMKERFRLSDDEMEYGPDMLKTMAKVASMAASGIVKDQLAPTQAHLARESRERFYNDLDALVTDWEATLHTPAFQAWRDANPPLSDALETAREIFDSHSAATIFGAYFNSNVGGAAPSGAPPSAPPSSSPTGVYPSSSGLITPPPTASPDVPVRQPVVTPKQLEKHLDEMLCNPRKLADPAQHARLAQLGAAQSG